MRVKFKIFSVFLLACAVFCVCLFPSSVILSQAEESTSYILDDLKKADSFSESNYPLDVSDNNLYVEQIAESTDKELLIYVYQPSGKNRDFRASSINISTSINDAISFYNYKLEYLNSSETLYKYRVKDFTVLSVPTRYYVITTIYRPFVKGIDEEAGYDNVISEVDFEVGKQYCFYTLNGKPQCDVVEVETIEITDKFVGYVSYSDGFKFYPTCCSSHFVAFNTDKPIDQLLEADVFYTSQRYQRNVDAYPLHKYVTVFAEKEDGYAYLKYTDKKVEHTGSGFGAATYTWDRIETVDQFLSENEVDQNTYSGAIIDVSVGNKITDEGIEALEGKKWVLRFLETEYSLAMMPDLVYPGCLDILEVGTIVGDVSILRLKFEYNGITYNLGTIDNKQSGSGKPINEEWVDVEIKAGAKKWIILAIIVILTVIVLIILWKTGVLPTVFHAVWWFITLPFRGIAALCKSISKRRKQKRELALEAHSPTTKTHNKIKKEGENHEKDNKEKKPANNAKAAKKAENHKKAYLRGKRSRR